MRIVLTQLTQCLLDHCHESGLWLRLGALTLLTLKQRWLGIRVDFLGSLLTFAVALLTVGTRYTISPAQTGVVLSFILSIQQVSTIMALDIIAAHLPFFFLLGVRLDGATAG
jgi:hypothetical protein